MKKVFAILLSAALLFSLAACASKGNEPGSSTNGVDPLTLLQTVWNSHSENEKFAVSGGDLSPEHMKEDEPGVFSISDASELDRELGFPEAEVSNITAAASLVHMMNANTFTCGAFQLKDGVDAAALAKKVEQNIQSRQWMCGFPDKLVIASAGGCLVVLFGAEDLPPIPTRPFWPTLPSHNALFEYSFSVRFSPRDAAALFCGAAADEKRRPAALQSGLLRLGRTEIPASDALFHRTGVSVRFAD